ANYGGILIIWDRMFGSFVPEGKRPTYGLTKNVESYNLLKVGFHEYGSILRDVRAAGSWRDKLGYVFGPPGWQPKQALSLNASAQGG
ncbi:MAG TPA: sterol desaturase family protein, partial [Amycolatopsis sp.]|nr:sterol desaturase family protein [Amycolatopsis sp.]